MNLHDKHQYYFEKYLRNEMRKDERNALDAKLSEDAPLRMAFEYYKLNRQQLLEQLIQEHALNRKDNRFNKLIFLLISLTGLALTFNYFVYKNETTSTIKPETQKNIFIRYIPFLNWENRSDKKAAPVSQKSIDTALIKVANTDPIDTLEPSLDGNERLASDQFISDTFITIGDEIGYKKWQLLTDSNTTDTTVDKENLVVPTEKTNKILVEFWQSPVGYSGYLFSQNKLVIYGLSSKTNLFIFKQNEMLHAAFPNKKIMLVEQFNFIKF